MSKYEIKESGTLVYYMFEMFDKKTGERVHPSKEESDHKISIMITGCGHQFPEIERQMIVELANGRINQLEFMYDGVHVVFRVIVLATRDASSGEMKKQSVNWTLENKIKDGLRMSPNYAEWLQREDFALVGQPDDYDIISEV